MTFVLLQDKGLFLCAAQVRELIKKKGRKIMYEKVSPNLNFVEREKNVEKFWNENHIF